MRLYRILSIGALLQTALWGAGDSFRDLASDLVDQAGISMEKTVIAVLPFEDNTEGVKKTRLGEVVAEELTTALIRRGIRVAERAELRKVLREHELRKSGTVSDSEAAALAKGLGAAVVVGTVRRTESGAIRVNARLVQISDMRALSAGSINLDPDLVEKYQSPEKRKNRNKDAITLDFLGGISFYQLQWTRRYEEFLTNPSNQNERYFTTEQYDAMKMKPGPNASIRLVYFPAQGGTSAGRMFFVSFGFQYVHLASEAQKVNYSITKNSQFASSSLPATISQGSILTVGNSGIDISLFAIRPGVFFRLNLSDDLTFFYIGPQLNFLSLNWKNTANQKTFSSLNLELTLGFRIDFGSIGFLIEGSVPFLNTYSYDDERAGIFLQDKSSLTLTGGNLAAGLSFKL